MLENTTSLQEFEKVMNVPFAVIIASCIIIIVTTNMTDTNGLSALLGGYSGLFLGMIFIMILNLLFTKTSYFDMFPIVMVVIIIGLLVSYLYIYFDKISKGEVSGYYSSFSLLSTIFLFTQTIIIINAMYGKTQKQDVKLFSDTTFALLGLFSVINIIIVLTIGVVLHFYSTQG